MPPSNLFYLFPSKGTPFSPFPSQHSAVFTATINNAQTTKLVGTNGPFNFEYTQPFSVSCWIQFAQTFADANESCLVANFYSADAMNSLFQGWLFAIPGVSTANQRNLAFGLYGSSSLKAVVTSNEFTFHTGDWIHAVATSDGSGTAAGLKLYVNAVQQTNDSVVDTLAGNSILSSAPLTIGQINYETSEGLMPYTGNMNQTTIWKTALSQAQVTALYNNGLGLDPRLSTAAASLFAWYPLASSKDNSSTVFDAQGTNNLTNTNVTLLGSLPPAVFTEASSGIFNGTSSQLTLGDHFDQSGSDIQSFSFWVKPTTLPGGGCTFFSKMDPSVVGTFCFARGTTGKGLEFIIKHAGAGEIDVSTPEVLTTGAWQHCVITYNGNGSSSGVAMYINGVAQTLNNLEDDLSSSASNGDPFILGTDPITNVFYNGLMDEFAIFNVVLNPTQVTAMYNGGVPTNLASISGLQSWYRFENMAIYPDDSTYICDRIGYVNGVNTAITYSANVP